MTHPQKVRHSREEPPALHSRAMENLRFIRETMESAGSFTAVPGWGGVLVGLTALGAAAVAAQQSSAGGWIVTWLVEALVAFLIGGWAMDRKARAVNLSLFRGPGRRFALGMAPPMVAGGLMTALLYGAGLVSALPGTWLLMYGVGVVTGGAFSVRTVPLMGLCFMSAGAGALFSPAVWGAWYMALGFGGLHILFGIIILRKHGG